MSYYSVRHSVRTPATFGKLVSMRCLDLPTACAKARHGYHAEGGTWTIRDMHNVTVETFASPMWRLGPRVPAQEGIKNGRAWTAYTRDIGGYLYRFVRHTSLWDSSSVGIDVYKFKGEPNVFTNPWQRHFHFGASME